MRIFEAKIAFAAMAMIMGFGLAGDIAAGELERRLAVIRFRANLVKEGQAEIVADHLRTEFVNQRKYLVVDRENMETLLKEQQFQLTDCTEASCAVVMGEILNVKWIIIGSLSKIEGEYLLTADMVDVQTAQITRSISRSDKTLIGLLRFLPQVAQQLSGETVEPSGEFPSPADQGIQPIPGGVADKAYLAPLPVPRGVGMPPTITFLETPKGVMNLKDAASVRFRYRGQDERWIEGYRYRLDDQEMVETRRSFARFANLTQGGHVFQVQAKDCDGNYSEPAKYEFRIRNLPPEVRISSPVKDEKVVGTELKVVLSATDDGRVVKYRCGINNVRNAVEQAGTTFIFDVADGKQRIYAQAVDDGGSQSDWVEQEVEFTFSDGSVSPGVSPAPSTMAAEGFVFIQPGTFTMGSPRSASERDKDEKQHMVKLTKGFYLQATEVTQEQYESVMGENPSEFKGSKRPVEKVSWYDALKFCNELSKREGLESCYRISGSMVTWDRNANGYRLPTEAEWEYACRAGTSTPFHTGRCLSTNDTNYDGRYPYSGCSKGKYRKQTWDVGSGKPNAWGLHDMHGNVWEWCWDWHDDYPGGFVIDPRRGVIDRSRSVIDPIGPPGGSYRVMRGGSWNNRAKSCRSADRYFSYPVGSGRVLGLRLASNM